MFIHLQGKEAPVDPQLITLVEERGDDGYRIYLENLRWPGGPECPRCFSQRLCWLESRSKHHCSDCRYQFKVTAGTVFHQSHLPLTKWFLAIWLMLASEHGLPATHLQEILGGSYKTAWFLEHRIRTAIGGPAGELGPMIAYSRRIDVDRATTTTRAASDQAPSRVIGAPPSWPLLKRLVAGSHLSLNPRYLTSYWNEIRWRDANRGNPNAFRETVIALLDHPPVSYEQLIGPGQSRADERGVAPILAGILHPCTGEAAISRPEPAGSTAHVGAAA
jgi:transposase-like protein